MEQLIKIINKKQEKTQTSREQNQQKMKESYLQMFNEKDIFNHDIREKAYKIWETQDDKYLRLKQLWLDVQKDL